MGDDLAVASTSYALQLPGIESDTSQTLEQILAVLGEIWKTTCLRLMKANDCNAKDEIICFLNLHHLLLRVSQVQTGLCAYAVATARKLIDLIENPESGNLKQLVPDLGRFLVRFLLAQDEAPLQTNIESIVKELFRRNVRWVPTQ